jgi:hypothetical protein
MLGQRSRCAQHHVFFSTAHAVSQLSTPAPQSYGSPEVVLGAVVLVLVLEVVVLVLCSQAISSCSQHHFFFCADHHCFQ